MSTGGGKPKKLLFNPKESLRYVKCFANSSFDESVDVALNLGVDPRKPNQSVRGVVALPHGTGRQTRVAVFAKGDKADEARAAGAAVVGAEDLVELVQSGKLDFDRCIATPDMMPLVGRVARVLGPRGLMPNPKLGTITTDIAGAVKTAQQGQVEFRTNKQGCVHACVGKVSFTEEQLLDNLRALMVAIANAKPEGAKGRYIKSVFLNSTRGPSFGQDLRFVEPSSAFFMYFDGIEDTVV